VSIEEADAADRFVRLRDASTSERARALPWVVARLNGPSESRIRSLELLGYWGEMRGLRVEAHVVDRVRVLTRDEEPEVRKEACATLALIRCREPFDPSEALISALADEASGVRQEAAAALGDLRIEAARAPLGRRLDDHDPAVRFEAAFALSALGDGSGRSVLEESLDHPAFRAFAIEGLRRLSDPASRPALERLARAWTTPWPERLAAQAALAHLGDTRALERIQRRARRGRHEVRAHAIYLVGHARLHGARREVDAIADDPRSSLRATAVRAVAELGDPSDTARLRAWLEDVDAAVDVRLEALDGLVARGRSADVEAALEAGDLNGETQLVDRAREQVG